MRVRREHNYERRMHSSLRSVICAGELPSALKTDCGAPLIQANLRAARPSQPAVIAAGHRSRVTAVADVPDAKHRLVVREQRRRRMRVICPRPRRTARDDDLPRRVVSEIDVRQRLLVLLPQRLLLRRRGFPGTFLGLGGIGGFRLLVGESGHGREQ